MPYVMGTLLGFAKLTLCSVEEPTASAPDVTVRYGFPLVMPVALVTVTPAGRPVRTILTGPGIGALVLFPTTRFWYCPPPDAVDTAPRLMTMLPVTSFGSGMISM